MAAELVTPAAGDDDAHLPPEICREILIRLPVKSILRFRSVCKSWYSLISCPKFISDFSNLNKDPNRVLLHIYIPEKTWADFIFSFSSHDKSFTESHEHDEIPESYLGGCTAIVGSCNGLICVKDCGYIDDVHGLNLLIWNPSLRKIVELPSPTFTRFDSYFGFGFDPETSDYKVLSCSPVDFPERNDDSPDMVFQIFDLGKGVWRDISPVDPSIGGNVFDSIEGYYAICYLDGAVHWGGLQVLLSFSFRDECFREISMPDCAEFTPSEDDSDNTKTAMCVTFGGLIYVIVSTTREDGFTDMSKSCSIWAMKEYGVTESWTKMFDIDLQSARGLPNTSLSLDQFHLWENGEILMVRSLAYSGKQEVVLYNIGNRKSKCIFSHTRCTRSVWLYEESLVLM